MCVLWVAEIKYVCICMYVYNKYSARQCIQYVSTHASEKAVYNLRKIQFTLRYQIIVIE